MQRLLELPMGIDLLPFSAFLWRAEIAHRITEECGQQVLWLDHSANALQVEQFYADWQAGLLQLSEVKQGGWKCYGLMNGPLADWKRMPATLLFIVACLIVALLTRLGSDYHTIAWFSFLNFEIDSIDNKYIRYVPLSDSLSYGEYWRLITPIFLHFGILHLAFNMLWLLEFGRRLERYHGSLFLVLLIMVTGLISNVSQYNFSDTGSLFGGFSGVIYGLMGFLWMREKAQPGLYGVPSGIYMFMLIWMVIGFTDVLGMIGLGQTANSAHAGGLLVGTACGWLYNRFWYKKEKSIKDV